MECGVVDEMGADRVGCNAANESGLGFDARCLERANNGAEWER